MADKLFQKRKAKQKKDQQRRKASRETYDRVLIVCEDAHAAPSYFTALKNDLRINAAKIRICGEECGSAPISVVEFALEEYEKDPDFDRIFCVIDRDSHESFYRAVDKAKSAKLGKGHKIQVISSWPCFEIWLLLHFEYSTRQYQRTQNKSPCDLVISLLKSYISEYQKSLKICKEIYGKTKALTPEALKNAQRLRVQNEKTGTFEPSTEIDILVDYLRSHSKSP